MWNDPIVEELHQIRADHGAEFNHDLRLMVDALKVLEQEWLSKHPELDYCRLMKVKDTEQIAEKVT